MTSIYDAITKDHEHHRTLLDRIDKTEGDSPEPARSPGESSTARSNPIPPPKRKSSTRL